MRLLLIQRVALVQLGQKHDSFENASLLRDSIKNIPQRRKECKVSSILFDKIQPPYQPRAENLIFPAVDERIT